MIIDNTYFKGEIYLPFSAPSVSDDIKRTEEDVTEFINDYSRDVLLKSLGTTLFIELESQLDDTEENGLIDGADSKWDELLNGKVYTNPEGEDVIWRGIRYKSKSTSVYNRSFIANYVYVYHESNSFITRSEIGNQIQMGKNGETVVPNQKVVKSWSKFVKLVQGDEVKPNIVRGCGVDYFNAGGSDVSMYKFINDSNNLVEDTYIGFNPKTWNDEVNEFGI
jgi:hypothetical protein